MPRSVLRRTKHAVERWTRRGRLGAKAPIARSSEGESGGVGFLQGDQDRWRAGAGRGGFHLSSTSSLAAPCLRTCSSRSTKVARKRAWKRWPTRPCRLLNDCCVDAVQLPHAAREGRLGNLDEEAAAVPRQARASQSAPVCASVSSQRVRSTSSRKTRPRALPRTVTCWIALREVKPKRPGHAAQVRDGLVAATGVTLSAQVLECNT